ncbi:MAG: B12-binding domain-containing radical SAM protein [Deltaproteobacteria bacterium]|nr:B12-binding domain-containing radical SAM protein [Deltaproteobacteria bacterium]
MKILLINPPSKELHQIFFPLGLASIAGALLGAGHEVKVWDINALKSSKEEVLENIDNEIDSFFLVGITALAGDYPYVKWLTRSIKNISPDSRIVVGGHLASALPEFLMEKLPVDIVVRGEGEEAITDLLDALEKGSDLGRVRGIYYRSGHGGIRATNTRPPVEDLDRLPLPPWHLFPMTTYLSEPHRGFNQQGSREDHGLMSIMASRGCPFHCLYCDHTIKGYRPRYRSVERVIQEIKASLMEYGDRIKTFHFWDDILIWDKEWTRKFCECLLQEKLDMKWSCNAHVNLVEYPLISLMKEAGCTNVRFGIESGSQGILDALNKGVNVDRALDALKTCLEAGLSLTLYFMVGMEGETDRTVNETIAFLDRLITPFNVYQFNKIHLFMLTPFPGTELFDLACQKGLIPDIDAFLHRGCDAYFDIPLNISGCPDQKLSALKQKLEREVGLIIGDRRNRLHNALFAIKKRSLGE